MVRFEEGQVSTEHQGLITSSIPSKLRRKVDPEVWITYTEDLRTCHDDDVSKRDDDHFVTHILNSLKNESILFEIKILKKGIGVTIDSLTIGAVKNGLSLAYERLNDNERKPVDYDDEEPALVSFGPFEGRCTT